jgi:3-hydroxyisobutyrate dehydrogenase
MKVGFIGLGNVGGKLARSLLRNGFAVSVRDLDPGLAEPFLEQGATWADSPARNPGTVCGFLGETS